MHIRRRVQATAHLRGKACLSSTISVPLATVSRVLLRLRVCHDLPEYRIGGYSSLIVARSRNVTDLSSVSMMLSTKRRHDFLKLKGNFMTSFCIISGCSSLVSYLLSSMAFLHLMRKMENLFREGCFQLSLQASSMACFHRRLQCDNRRQIFFSLAVAPPDSLCQVGGDGMIEQVP